MTLTVFWLAIAETIHRPNVKPKHSCSTFWFCKNL